MSEFSDTAGRQNEPTGIITSYNHLKERTIDVVGKMLRLDLTDRRSCIEFKEKLEANAFNLVVVGQFKRGKTCLINALLGAELLPMSVVPLTSIVTVLAYGEALAVRVFFNDGKQRDVPVEELPGYVTESGNPRNEKEVREVVVFYPSPYLRDGVRLIDTPGVGSVYVHNTDVAYRCLPKSDAALFLLSIDQPVSSAELEFLTDVRQFADRIFFLLNKIDYLQEEEISRALAFSRTAIEQIMGPGIKVFPISAKLALRGSLEKSPDLTERSRLADFSGTLGRFLMKEKGKILLGSVVNNLLKILARERLGIELELKSLKTPVEQMRDRITAFASKKEELLREKRSFEVLFNSEIDRKIIKELDRALVQLKRDLVPRMEGQFTAFCEERKDLSLKDLNDALARFVSKKIQEELSAWREHQDEQLAQTFEATCRQFAGKMNQLLDSLLSFSSQLFSVPFEQVEAESLWMTESAFQYKFREEAVGLDMLTDSLTQIVPQYISSRFQRFRNWAYRTANRVILSKRKQHMMEAIEMQAGRIRFDFTNRLSKSAAGFRLQMIGKMETVAEGITRAIERGTALGSSGEEEATKLEAILGEKLDAMERIRDDLSWIREAAKNL